MQQKRPVSPYRATKRRLGLRLASTALCCSLLSACSLFPSSDGTVPPSMPHRPAKIASIDPASGLTQGLRGRKLLEMAENMAEDGQHHAAIPLFRRVTKMSPMAQRPLISLGDSLMALGQYEEAVTAYETVLDGDDNNVPALIGAGKAYLALNRPAMAERNLQIAATKAPENPSALNALALSFDLQGYHEAALEVYHDAITSDPNSLSLQNNYGLSLALHNDPRAAISILKQVALHPQSNASHRQNLALAYSLAGHDTMALRLLSIDQDSISARQNMTFFHNLAGMTPNNRLRAMTGLAVQPKHDLHAPANVAFAGDEEIKQQTAARLVTPAPAPVAEVFEDDVPPLLGPEGWALQIAAYRKKSELMPGWRMLKKKYADIIGHLEPRRSEVDFGPRKSKPSGFFYRLNAGPLTSYKEAKEACQEIRKRGTDCWVRPPEPTEGEVPEADKDKKETRLIVGSNDNATTKQPARTVDVSSPPQPIGHTATPTKTASLNTDGDTVWVPTGRTQTLTEGDSGEEE